MKLMLSYPKIHMKGQWEKTSCFEGFQRYGVRWGARDVLISWILESYSGVCPIQSLSSKVPKCPMFAYYSHYGDNWPPY